MKTYKNTVNLLLLIGFVIAGGSYAQSDQLSCEKKCKRYEKCLSKEDSDDVTAKRDLDVTVKDDSVVTAKDGSVVTKTTTKDDSDAPDCRKILGIPSTESAHKYCYKCTRG